MLCASPAALASPLFQLPDDLFYEILTYLDAEQLIVLEQTNQTLRRFILLSRAIWLAAVKRLGQTLPVPLPYCFSESTTSIPQLHASALKALRLDALWHSDTPKPRRSPRFLRLVPPLPLRSGPSPEPERIAMLRVLPGGKQVLTTTYSARVLCWDLRDGTLLGEWHHGGAKIESLDVDIVKDHAGRPAVVLAVSVEHRYVYHEEPVATYKLHVLRVDIHDIPGAPFATFKQLSETCWRQPLYIVSLEGDYAAGYSCDIGQQPLGSFMVLVMNWKTRMATRIEFDDLNLWFYNWPTLQVLGHKILLHEERGDSPNTCLIDIPTKLFPIYPSTAAPVSPLVISYCTLGGDAEVSYQTRFSKKWRGDFNPSDERSLSLLSVSDNADEQGLRSIQLRTISDLIQSKTITQSAEIPRPVNQPRQEVWSKLHSSLLSNADGLMFTFCLGRYGHRPFWIERPIGGNTRLAGFVSPDQPPRTIILPDEIKLDDCRFIDWDDAEGVLCALTRQGAWVLEFV